jgi:hypothetical protein
MKALDIDLEKADITKFGGGLCAKLYCFFSACELAIQSNIQILEPTFGWKQKCYFSQIYDINYFNNYMKKYNKNRNIIIPIKYKHLIYNVKYVSSRELWKLSEKRLTVFRSKGQIPKWSLMIIVLNGLRLCPRLHLIKNQIGLARSSNGIHIRIEKDWNIYSNYVNLKDTKEKLLTDMDTIVELYKNKWNDDEIYFTTGENHLNITEKLTGNGIKSTYYFNDKLEYEMNAAINFELMVECENFIGISRSMFSNLISLKRSLINKKSFIYNYDNSINERIDNGLYPEGRKSISKKVIIK